MVINQLIKQTDLERKCPLRPFVTALSLLLHKNILISSPWAFHENKKTFCLLNSELKYSCKNKRRQRWLQVFFCPGAHDNQAHFYSHRHLRCTVTPARLTLRQQLCNGTSVMYKRLSVCSESATFWLIDSLRGEWSTVNTTAISPRSERKPLLIRF